MAAASRVGRLVVNSHAPSRSTTPAARRSASPCRRRPARPSRRAAEQREHEQRHRGAGCIGDVISTRLPETWCSAASTVTAARIGPAHGVQTTESAAPSTRPDVNPSPPGNLPAARAASGWNRRPAQLRERWRHEQEAGERQEHHGDRVQQILRQAERREDARGRQGEHHERERKTDGDTKRPAATARGPAGEHHGHDRKHAR